MTRKVKAVNAWVWVALPEMEIDFQGFEAKRPEDADAWRHWKAVPVRITPHAKKKGKANG